MNKIHRKMLLIGMAAIALSFAACGAQAKTGDTVKIEYKGTLADGTVFDPGAQPLTFTLGTNQVIPGFESAVAGMRVGESKTVTIPVDQAYGPVRPEFVSTHERKNLPNVVDPTVGQTLTGTGPEGQTLTARITAVTDKTVTIDENHPLAGKDLTFYIKLLEITEGPKK